ncbi:uncharacterized protein DMAD_01019 [Drosophila madeirensis]|uniref:CH-like domain-containing protein n=1 Tax=Drosophila madeirensis TaxID=30013 RepID=A0AAU9G0I0_DROMD
MHSIRQLTDLEQSRLGEWLGGEGVTLNCRSRRDTYSDVRPVAEILKKVHPAIELRCYTAASSFARRLQNWEVFAFRELRKLGLRLKAEDLKQLAGGRPGAVDWLLFSLIGQKNVRPSATRLAPRSVSLGAMCRSRFVSVPNAASSRTLDKDWRT